MSLAYRVVTTTIKGLTRLLCRIDDSQLSLVPAKGPLILVCNHVNFLEVPLLFTHLQPRPVTGFAKAETWNNPAMAYLFDLWQAIPIKRGAPDLSALRRGLRALEAGQILAIAPEGTRSGSGVLGPGHPGVTLLALQSQAPLLPLVYFGGERLRHNLKQMRRTDFRIVVGNPFYVETEPGKATRQQRQQITDEIMYQLAALLPPRYRGGYTDLARASEFYLRFPPGSQSNLTFTPQREQLLSGIHRITLIN